MTLADWTFLGSITLAAAVVQAATGFGFAIVAVPLYLLVLDSVVVVQLAILITPLVTLPVAPRLLPHLRGRLLAPLMAGTTLGLPLGLWGYAAMDLRVLKIVVAVLIVGFAALLLAGRRRDSSAAGPSAGGGAVRGGAWAWPAGFVSGALATSLAMPGPPAMLYLAALHLEKNVVRAAMLILVVYSYGCAAALQALTVGIGRDAWEPALVLAPLALIGGPIGHRLSTRLSPSAFRAAVLCLLIATGSYLLVTTLAAR